MNFVDRTSQMKHNISCHSTVDVSVILQCRSKKTPTFFVDYLSPDKSLIINLINQITK